MVIDKKIFAISLLIVLICICSVTLVSAANISNEQIIVYGDAEFYYANEPLSSNSIGDSIYIRCGDAYKLNDCGKVFNYEKKDYKVVLESNQSSPLTFGNLIPRDVASNSNVSASDVVDAKYYLTSINNIGVTGTEIPYKLGWFQVKYPFSSVFTRNEIVNSNTIHLSSAKLKVQVSPDDIESSTSNDSKCYYDNLRPIMSLEAFSGGQRQRVAIGNEIVNSNSLSLSDAKLRLEINPADIESSTSNDSDSIVIATSNNNEDKDSFFFASTLLDGKNLIENDLNIVSNKIAMVKEVVFLYEAKIPVILSTSNSDMFYVEDVTNNQDINQLGLKEAKEKNSASPIIGTSALNNDEFYSVESKYGDVEPKDRDMAYIDEFELSESKPGFISYTTSEISDSSEEALNTYFDFIKVRGTTGVYSESYDKVYPNDFETTLDDVNTFVYVFDVARPGYNVGQYSITQDNPNSIIFVGPPGITLSLN